MGRNGALADQTARFHERVEYSGAIGRADGLHAHAKHARPDQHTIEALIDCPEPTMSD